MSKKAIISVFDKTGVVDFARGLTNLGFEIYSTGGTLSLLREHHVAAGSISDYTGFPEIMDGRVKTLHPKVFGGLLYLRENPKHCQQAAENGITAIDMVVVNLYPFEQTIAKPGTSFEEAVEQIDIGGPSMLRAASKNFEHVAVLCDPADYGWVLEELRGSDAVLSTLSKHRLAAKVFTRTSAYDQAIAAYLSGDGEKELLPEDLQLGFKKTAALRYGENPHQEAALYHSGKETLEIKQLHGKELSYNNLMDVEAAWDVVQEFTEPAACVMKHNTPCGIAAGTKLEAAAGNAIACDPEAAFGGIIGLNRRCDAAAAKKILSKLAFLEVIVSPAFDAAALKLLRERKNLRLIQVKIQGKAALNYRFTKLGLLLQEADGPLAGEWENFRKTAQCVTHKKPTAKDLKELFFAWRTVKTIKSNAIVLSKGFRTLGIGAGQMSRVDSVRIACRKAGKAAAGSYLGSDGFFPMPDNIQIAAKHKIRAIVQPGGSIRDKDVIAAADKKGIIMVTTGKRHFRH